MHDKKLCMIGLGRLGLSIALCFERAGWDIVGVDISTTRVQAVNRRQLQSREPHVEELLRESRHLRATESLSEGANHAQLIYVCVAAPSNGIVVIDTQNLGKVLMALNDLKLHDKHIVIVTTIMPNYIEDVAKVLLSDCPRTTVSYVPDGASPISYGRLIWGISHPDMILIGEGSKEAGDIIERAHTSMVFNNPTINRMNTTSAEITKIAISSIATLKITFSNYAADIADKTPGAHAHDVLRAVGADSRIKRSFITRGYGFGGPCLPRDNRALCEHARDVGVDAVLLTATHQCNEFHTKFLADKLMDTAANGGSIVIEDVAFRPNAKTDVIDESRKLALGLELAKRGIKVTIRDREPIIKLVRSVFGAKFSYDIISANGVSHEHHGPPTVKRHKQVE